MNRTAAIREAVLQPTGAYVAAYPTARVVEWPAPQELPNPNVTPFFTVFKINGGEPDYALPDEEIEVEFFHYGAKENADDAKLMSDALKATIHGVVNESVQLADGFMGSARMTRNAVIMNDPDTKWWFVHDIYSILLIGVN